jgi:XTP/dITP diphosphohydrolase
MIAARDAAVRQALRLELAGRIMTMVVTVDLLLASQNPGKLNEMRLLVDGMPFRVVGPRQIGIDDAPDETGENFIENAVLKALHYAQRSGRLTVADDSGLSVDALGGGPGLHSSRFGGEGASDLDRNRLLLEKLRDVPWEARGAHFTSAVAVARGDQLLFQAQESVAGMIAPEMRGENGFGYDPLFFYPPYGRTFGQVAREEKDRVSHRGKAFARLREFLATLPVDLTS